MSETTIDDATLSIPTATNGGRTPATATKLRVEVIATASGLDALREAWNAMVDDNPLNRWEWMTTWWRHYREDNDRLYVITVRDDSNTIVGIAPLYLNPSRWLGRCLRFLGSGEVCTDYAAILAAAGWEAAVANEIATHLAETADKVWDMIELTGVAADDAMTGQLCTRVAAAGLAHHVSTIANCWRLEFPTTWDAYLATLSKSRRGRVRKLIRSGFDTGKVVWKNAKTPEELEHGYELLKDLHQRRRNSVGDSGCFASARFTAFHHEMLQTYHAQGRARLHWVEIDGEPIAAEYDLVGDDVVCLYQSGMNPEMAAERPGWLCVIASLRSAQEQGYAAFDFLRGDEPYKAHWRAKPRPIVAVHIVAYGLAARGRYRVLETKTRLSRIARQGLVSCGLKQPAP